MPSNFDNAAPFYDRLSRLVFGRSIIEAQVYLLNYVPADSNILIVGGGTGWILQELANIHPQGLRITYVEISAKMMALSKQRQCGLNQVDFINGAVEDIEFSTAFDVAIAPFLFDNLNEGTLKKVFEAMHQSLKNNGLWLCADFKTDGKLWQAVLLKSMYLFFRFLCGIEAKRMPNIDHYFAQNGYTTLQTKKFYGNFIIAKLYLKN